LGEDAFLLVLATHGMGPRYEADGDHAEDVDAIAWCDSKTISPCGGCDLRCSTPAGTCEAEILYHPDNR
jgi:hypothetical protein